MASARQLDSRRVRRALGLQPMAQLEQSLAESRACWHCVSHVAWNSPRYRATAAAAGSVSLVMNLPAQSQAVVDYVNPHLLRITVMSSRASLVELRTLISSLVSGARKSV